MAHIQSHTGIQPTHTLCHNVTSATKLLTLPFLISFQRVSKKCTLFILNCQISKKATNWTCNNKCNFFLLLLNKKKLVISELHWTEKGPQFIQFIFSPLIIMLLCNLCQSLFPILPSSLEEVIFRKVMALRPYHWDLARRDHSLPHGKTTRFWYTR